MNLILLTTTYPYDAGAEQTFVGRELPYLSRHFEHITVVPKSTEGKPVRIPVHVPVEEGLAAYIKRKSFLGVLTKALLSGHFYQDLFARPEILVHLTMFARLIRFVGEAELLQEWLGRWIVANRVDLKNTLFYSFWFDQVAMGVGLLKDRFPELRLVSRAHGYDVYEERYNPPYWPCRRTALAKLNQLFLASEHARNYLLKKYPEHAPLFETAHLGVEEPGFTCLPSSDGVFRIVSCSSLVPLKRIDLLINGIARAAQLRPEQEFIWRHFGDGPIRMQLKERLQGLPANAQGYLDGYLPNERIMDYYRKNPVDVFVNVSESEGGSPVSIMEAISCNIPVIATAVGGNPEIVWERNGSLLGENPTSDEIAAEFLKLLDHPEEFKRKRKESHAIWQERYVAQDNFNAFANRLKTIMGAMQ